MKQYIVLDKIYPNHKSTIGKYNELPRKHYIRCGQWLEDIIYTIRKTDNTLNTCIDTTGENLYEH